MPSSSWLGQAVSDGTDPTIEATVFDYSASNPVAVRLTDTSGNYVAGSGGGAVTIADGADVAEGATADSAATNSTSSWSVVALLKGLFVKLGLISAQVLDYDTGAGTASQNIVGLALPASGGPVAGGTSTNPIVTAINPGTALIGKVGIDQTTPGTTNAVAVITGQNGIAGGTGVDGATVPRITLATNVALPPGTNAIGKLSANSGIDIGDVDVTSLPALVAGTALIGKVGIDQTTPGTTNAVAVIAGQNGVAGGTGVDGATVQRVTIATNVGLPAGSAILGKVGIDQTTPGTTNLVALAANQSVNVAQINGIAPLMGAGNTGTGSPRVTISTDDINLAAINAVNGVKTDAKVITDATGTLQQYLRGLIYLLITTANFPAQAISGSAQTCIDLATDVAAGNFSGAPAATFSNNDALCTNAQFAKCMIELPDWAAAPVALTTVDLFVLLKDVDGTDDETDAPSGTAQGGAHFCCTFIIAAADALQRRVQVIDLWALGLVGSVTGDFYIRNNTAQNLNNDGGTNCVLKVTPFSPGMVM